MPRLILQTLAILALFQISLADAGDTAKIKALIVDGQNNHTKWPQTTMMMRDMLEGTGRFTVDIERTQFTWKGGKLLESFPINDGKTYEDLNEPKFDPDFAPTFADYDVVISNFGYKAAPWPDETNVAFENYVKNGGGFVVVHAADNSFGDWDAFNRIIGIGGWGGRNEKTGPYVYFNDPLGEVIRDTKPGKSGEHGPARPYAVVHRDTDHPITHGLPQTWMHSKDELYQKLRGPADNMTILATAYADPALGGTGRHEPIMMTIEYGKGRIYHTPMGHDDGAFECVGFITTLIRGTEWAATGEVTLDEVPHDFPGASQPSRREYEQALSH